MNTYFVPVRRPGPFAFDVIARPKWVTPPCDVAVFSLILTTPVARKDSFVHVSKIGNPANGIVSLDSGGAADAAEESTVANKAPATTALETNARG